MVHAAVRRALLVARGGRLHQLGDEVEAVRVGGLDDVLRGPIVSHRLAGLVDCARERGGRHHDTGPQGVEELFSRHVSPGRAHAPYPSITRPAPAPHVPRA